VGEISKASSETPAEVLQQIMYDIDTNRDLVKKGTVAYSNEAKQIPVPGTDKKCKFGDTATLKKIVKEYLLNKNVKDLQNYRENMREYLKDFFVDPKFKPLT
jgi:hypothetical protein